MREVRPSRWDIPCPAGDDRGAHVQRALHRDLKRLARGRCGVQGLLQGAQSGRVGVRGEERLRPHVGDGGGEQRILGLGNGPSHEFHQASRQIPGAELERDGVRRPIGTDQQSGQFATLVHAGPVVTTSQFSEQLGHVTHDPRVLRGQPPAFRLEDGRTEFRERPDRPVVGDVVGGDRSGQRRQRLLNGRLHRAAIGAEPTGVDAQGSGNRFERRIGDTALPALDLAHGSKRDAGDFGEPLLGHLRPDDAAVVGDTPA